MKIKCNKKSYVQEYECQVVKNGISFDGCLWTELNILWLQGIKTIGSCCGRHCNSPKNTAYIQVIKEDEQKMINLGYKPIENQYGNVIFKPKTIFLESEAQWQKLAVLKAVQKSLQFYIIGE